MSELEDTLKRALALVTDQCNELEGRVGVLARALADIEAIARVLHILSTGGVRTAMGTT